MHLLDVARNSETKGSGGTSMKRILVSIFAGMTLAGVCVAQSAQSEASGSASQATKVSDKNAQVASASQLQAGSEVQAALVKPIDAKKSKVGDEVIAKTTHDVKSEGRVVIPKGSKLVGHVTEAKVRSQGQATSELGVAFDHAILKNGEEMPLALGIQAIGRGQAATTDVEDDTMATGSGAMRASGARPSGGGGGALGAVRSTAGGVVDTGGSVAGSAGSVVNSGTGAVGGAASGSLSATSRGVVGMPGLNLSSQNATTANGSVISSQDSNVHLDSGTEMILRVNQ
jgi:hypothetical protein